MQILLGIHAIVRWLILILGLVVIVKYSLGAFRELYFGGFDRMIAAAYTGLLDLQALVGVILLVLHLSDGLETRVILHAIVSIAGVAVAHLNARWRESADTVKFRNGLLTLGGSFVLIIVGIFFITSVA